jgi:hypothetical protein
MLKITKIHTNCLMENSLLRSNENKNKNNNKLAIVALNRPILDIKELH